MVQLFILKGGKASVNYFIFEASLYNICIRLFRGASKVALRLQNVFLSCSRPKDSRGKLNFLITQTELYAHFMGGKNNAGADGMQEEILSKLEDSSTHRQIDIGGGVMVNVGQEDYGTETPSLSNL